MKKISYFYILFFIFLFNFVNFSFAQLKKSPVSGYGGLGYNIVIFTDANANDTYPFIDFDNGNFLTEINLFGGVKIGDNVGIELSPSFLFTNSKSNDGFYFTNPSGITEFYYPEEASLFMMALNTRVKFYPFASLGALSIASNLYVGAGAGPVFIRESFRNYVYPDLSSIYGSPTRIEDSKQSFWSQNYDFFIGIGTSGKFGYGFEVGYRMVNVNIANTLPLTTSLAENFNSVNIAAKLVFNF